MMTSVIPARLEFQCGHAALVSLPKIKNESSARRNERIAQEKIDARGRRCDFCGPLVTEVVATPLPTNGSTGSNSSNGTDGYHATPPKLVAQQPIVVAPVASEPTPVVAAPKPVVTAPKPVVATPKPVVAAAKPAVATPKPVVAAAKPAVATPKPVAAAAKPVVAAAKPVVATPKPVVAAAKPVVAARRAVRRRTSGHSMLSTAGKRYAVRFQVEQIVQATDLRDALRQVSSMGAVEVLAITAR